MPAAALLDRLRDWRAVVATAPTPEDPEVLGGRRAEHFLHTLVAANHNFRGAALFPNKRVPAGRRRREIDLIVVTPKRVHVIEVKNWSGALRAVGGAWVQTNRAGRPIPHPDLVADHSEKADAFLAYLAREGVAMDPATRAKYVSRKVIFMNPRLAVPDPAIAGHPDVLLAHRLNGYLGGQPRAGLGERLLGSVVQWCLDTDAAGVVMDGCFGSLAPDRVAAVRAAVDRLGTWDTLRYYGSRVEVGDLIRLTVGGRLIRRDEFEGRGAVSVRWTRHRGLGLVKAVTGVGWPGRLAVPGGGPLELSPRDTAFFHRPGEPAPVDVPLRRLDGITLG